MALGGPCPGSCNRRWREAQEAFKEALALYDPLDPDQSRPIPPEIRAWPGDPVWCSACSANISLRLHQLDDLASILQRYADGHREAPASPLVHGSSDAMSPSEAGDAAEDLAGMLSDWEGKYRYLRGWPSPRREEDLASVVTASSAWLSAHLGGTGKPGILTSAIAVDFGQGILSWHRDLSGATKAGTRKLTKPLRCPTPSCQQLTLTWVEGEDAVYCSNPDCRRVMSYADYEASVERLAGESKTNGSNAA